MYVFSPMQFHRFCMILREAEKIETEFKLRSCLRIKTIMLRIRESKFQEYVQLKPHWNDKALILFYLLRELCVLVYTQLHFKPYVCIETRKLIRTGRNFGFTLPLNINSILLLLRKSNLYLFHLKIIIIFILPLLSAMYFLSYMSYVNCHPSSSWITMTLDAEVFITQISAQANLLLCTYCFFGVPISISSAFENHRHTTEVIFQEVDCPYPNLEQMKNNFSQESLQS